MAIHWRPFRPYAGRICLTHGLLVEMLRNTQVFWEAYKEILQLNGKTASSNKVLKKMMEQMGLSPKKKRYSPKKAKKLIMNIETDFVAALNNSELMFQSLNIIASNDETLLYRSMTELSKLYHHISMIKHVPDYMILGLLEKLHALMHRMHEVQHHTWVMSKAHARGRVKLEELTILSTRAERRKIRMQTIEIDHLRSRIGRLKSWVLDLNIARSHDDIHRLHTSMTQLLHSYHNEIDDLDKILKELHVLTRRTELLFEELSKEAEAADLERLKKNIEKYSRKFKKIRKGFENYARREFRDMDKILKRLPKYKTKAA